MPTKVVESTSNQMNTVVVKIGAIFETVLSQQWVIFILIPLFVILGSVILKAYARQKFHIKREDLIVGFDLGITGCITLLVSSLILVNKQTITNIDQVQHYLMGIFIVLIFFIIVLFGAANVFRNKGWDDVNGQPTVRLNTLTLINLVGLFMLVAAFNLAGEA